MRLNELEGRELLYHTQKGFPENWPTMLPKFFKPGHIDLRYGGHAREEAMSDKYGHITLPKSISFSDTPGIKLIELGVIDNHISKLVVRYPYDKTRDLVIVFTPDGFVKTVWINLHIDAHKTLDLSRYESPKANKVRK